MLPLSSCLSWQMRKIQTVNQFALFVFLFLCFCLSFPWRLSICRSILSLTSFLFFFYSLFVSINTNSRLMIIKSFLLVCICKSILFLSIYLYLSFYLSHICFVCFLSLSLCFSFFLHYISFLSFSFSMFIFYLTIFLYSSPFLHCFSAYILCFLPNSHSITVSFFYPWF